MSLYRTYRPQQFSEVKGQEHVVTVLQAALKNKSISHAYLFIGPRGTGKTTTARLLARAINCSSPSQDVPCNTCETCMGALEDRLTDLVEIDAASHGLVDDARALVEQARFLPSQAQKKIYIIDEVHMLSKSAFNALLKIIEEPPEHVHFILATTEAHKVLDTITSRCQRFDFHLASREEISGHLQEVCKKESVHIDDEAAQLLAESARGSYRDSLSLLEQVIVDSKVTVDQIKEILGLSDQSATEELIQCVRKGDKKTGLGIIQEILQQGVDPFVFCQQILASLQMALHEEDGKPSQQLLLTIEHFFEALHQLRDPILPELPLQVAFLKSLPSSGPAPKPQELVQEEEPKGVKKPSEESTQNEASQTKTQTEEKKVQEDSEITSSGIAPKTQQNGEFDQKAFLESIEQISLKALLKYSELSWNNQRLRIRARSQFERDKLSEGANIQYLVQLLQARCGADAEIVVDDQLMEDSSSDGLSSQDLESVF